MKQVVKYNSLKYAENEKNLNPTKIIYKLRLLFKEIGKVWKCITDDEFFSLSFTMSKVKLIWKI